MAKRSVVNGKRKANRPNGQDEYATFSKALKKVLSVSHAEMKNRLAQASSARASSAKH